MRGLVYLSVLTLLAAWALGRLLRALNERTATDLDVPEIPCDACDLLVHPSRAHTHHHEPGCEAEGPTTMPCTCDFYLCPRCCPCSVAGLIAGARRYG